jgi:hypothetical protein
VNVVFGHERQVVIDHERQVRDVEAPRGDVGGHQDVDAPGFEVAERTVAGVLALVAVNHGGPDSRAIQVLADAIRAALRLAEHQRLPFLRRREHIPQDAALPAFRNGVNPVTHRRRDHLTLRDVHVDRRSREFGRQPRHLCRQRRRKQQRLTFAWQRRQDAAQRRQKAHVQHPIRFVQCQDLQTRQVDRALLHVIDQPSGRCHDHVDPVAERFELGSHRDAAEDRRDLHAGGRPVFSERLVNLDRQLARRHQDEAARRAWRGAPPAADEQPFDHRQAKCGRFARTCLRAGEQIASLEHDRDRL